MTTSTYPTEPRWVHRRHPVKQPLSCQPRRGGGLGGFGRSNAARSLRRRSCGGSCLRSADSRRLDGSEISSVPLNADSYSFSAEHSTGLTNTTPMRKMNADELSLAVERSLTLVIPNRKFFRKNHVNSILFRISKPTRSSMASQDDGKIRPGNQIMLCPLNAITVYDVCFAFGLLKPSA